MDSQDNIVTLSLRHKQIPILTKREYFNHANVHNGRLSIREYESFSISNNKSFIHVIGTNNFAKKRFRYRTYYYSDRADIYPLRILNNDGQIIKTLTIKVDSRYFPFNTMGRLRMIHELESFDKEMAADHDMTVNLRESERINYTGNNNYITIFNILTLLNEYSNIQIRFHEVIQHPLCFINKKYYKTQYPKRIDDISIKLSQLSPESKQYSFRKHVNYNTIENRWIKRIAIKIKHLARQSINYLERTEYYKLQPYYWNGFIRRLRNIQNYLDFITKDTFLKSISCHVTSLPLKLFYSPRYDSIYRLYKKIFNNNLQIGLNLLEKYRQSYLVKSTSILYELWTYIYVLKNLMSHGYQVKKIMYLGQSINLATFLSYGLQHGMSFHLNHNSISLHLIYNDSIDYNPKAPLWIFNQEIHNSNMIIKLRNYSKYRGHRNLHDKPDIRIDISVHNHYEGSIILDAKCSNRRTVSKSSRDLRQLLSYRFNTVYKDITYYQKIFGSNYPNPVQKVFVMFAGQNDTRSINGVNFIKIRPDYIVNRNFLINTINNCIEVINLLKKRSL